MLLGNICTRCIKTKRAHTIWARILLNKYATYSTSAQSSSHTAPFNFIKYTPSTEDRISTLTLSNPKKRNALSLATLNELKAALAQISMRVATDAKAAEKVLILNAEGPVFSSGHDLKELSEAKEPSLRALIFKTCTEVMLGVRNLEIPVIAQVDGLATAAGCQLVATCDLVVASEKSSFATPGVNIGLFCTTPGVAVARAVNTKKAMEMLLTGKPISAQEAMQHGLVNKVVPFERLTYETMDLAKSIVKASGDVIRLGKKAFYQQIQKDIVTAYSFAEGVMTCNLENPDAVEGLSAFLEKRHPNWK